MLSRIHNVAHIHNDRCCFFHLRAADHHTFGYGFLQDVIVHIFHHPPYKIIDALVHTNCNEIFTHALLQLLVPLQDPPAFLGKCIAFRQIPFFHTCFKKTAHCRMPDTALIRDILYSASFLFQFI